MVTIRNPVGGMLDDFEGACRLLLPNCLGVKKQGTKQTAAQISSTNGVNGDDKRRSTMKAGTGPSGVEYCFYKLHLFNKLSPAQKKDLKQYHAKNRGLRRENHDDKGGKSVTFTKDQLKGQVTSMVKEQVKAAQKAEVEEQSDLKQIASILVSMTEQGGATKQAAPTADVRNDRAMAAAMSINKIVQRKRENP